MARLEKDTDATGWAAVGQGVAIMLIILSIGGCFYLSDHKGPLVSIQRDAAPAKP